MGGGGGHQHEDRGPSVMGACVSATVLQWGLGGGGEGKQGREQQSLSPSRLYLQNSTVHKRDGQKGVW